MEIRQLISHRRKMNYSFWVLFLLCLCSHVYVLWLLKNQNVMVIY